MTFRKRRQPAPSFKMPPPYQPMTGERAQMMTPGNNPFCALFQVAATDDKVNYVICRGFDPRVKAFIDYEEGNSEKPGIPVAKPYGARAIDTYEVGEVHMAFLPLMRIGQNPGVAEATEGHPADLDEEVVILYEDDDSSFVNWMFVPRSGGTGTETTIKKQFCRFTADGAFTTSSPSVTGTIQTQWGDGTDHSTTTGVTFNNHLTGDSVTYMFEGDSGDAGIAAYSGAGTTWYIIQFECP
jgi:hypothetical protein